MFFGFYGLRNMTSSTSEMFLNRKDRIGISQPKTWLGAYQIDGCVTKDKNIVFLWSNSCFSFYQSQRELRRYQVCNFWNAKWTLTASLVIEDCALLCISLESVSAPVLWNFRWKSKKQYLINTPITLALKHNSRTKVNLLYQLHRKPLNRTDKSLCREIMSNSFPSNA